MPDASWLISNIQSPPLHKMLVEFLPTFHAKLSINKKVLAPPNEVLINIKDGITIRNEIVHGKVSEIGKKQLEKVLNAVKDLLYLLDVYCGHQWAFSLISSETQTALIEDSKK